MASDDFKDFQSPHEASVDRLVQALDRAYHRPGLLLWRSFLQGVMTAIGASVGTFIILTASVYVFQTLGGIELLKPTIEKLQDWMVDRQVRQLENLVPSSDGQAPSLPSGLNEDDLRRLLNAQ